MLRSLAMGAAVMAACAACGASSQQGSVAPTPSASPSRPSTAASSPSATEVPSYLASYSAAEQAAYSAAVAAYEKYVSADSRFRSAGRTTKAASGYYHRYALDWVASWANLSQLANNKVTVTGAGVVKSTRPTEIRLGDRSDVVIVRQCVDRSAEVVRQSGKVVNQPSLKTPHLYVTKLVKKAGETWWRSGIAEQGETC